jgi:hypothetical protein
MTTAGAFHCLDHHPQPVADVVGLGARLLPARHPRLGAAQFDDHLGPFDPLDDAVHQLADAAVEFVEDGVAFGLADLLENHLFGGLRGDAAERIGRLREEDLTADLRFGIVQARLFDRHLAQRIGDRLDHLPHREDVHLAAFRVVAAPHVFLGLVELAGGHHHGIFDRGHDHRGIDVLFAADLFDCLVQQRRHPALLPFHHKIRFPDPIQRQQHHPALHLEPDHSRFEARQPPLVKGGVFHRVGQTDANPAAGKPLEFRRTAQFPVESGRTDFQRVARTGNQVLDVEYHSKLFADPLAVAVGDSGRLVDINAQQSLTPHFPLDVDDFYPFRPGHTVGGLADPLQIQHPSPGATKKWAFAHREFRQVRTKKVYRRRQTNASARRSGTAGAGAFRAYCLGFGAGAAAFLVG